MVGFEEQIKLDNFKSQYHSILTNITTANSELEKVLVEKENKIGEVTSLDATIVALKEQIVDLKGKKNENTALWKEAVSELKGKHADKSSQVSSLASSIKELTTQHNSLKSVISDTKAVLVELESDKVKQLRAVELLDEQIDSLASQVSTLRLTVKSLEDEATALTLQISNDTEEHRRTKVKRFSEIEDIKKIAAEESAKLLVSKDYYAKKDAEYKRRESDILVVTRRLKRLYAEINPNIALKI